MAIIGVEALYMLDRGKFELRTREEAAELNLGKHARKIVDYVSAGPIGEPVRVDSIARIVGLSKKQAALALDCMVARRDPVFAKFKDSDVIEYLRTPQRGGWMQEALRDLDVAITQLGESYLARRMFNYGRMPWNYVPLIEKDGMPIYSNMQLNFLRNL
jgi:hypothetical protein